MSEILITRSDAGALRNISDWFATVEYQQRRSTYIHILIWLEHAPQFGVHSDEQVTFKNFQFNSYSHSDMVRACTTFWCTQ